MTLDPAAYADFTVPEGSRPKRVTDRCPSCGHAIEWHDEYANNGIDEGEWWTGCAAECPDPDCGLELRWEPNAAHRRAARRHRAADQYQDEAESGQLRFV